MQSKILITAFLLLSAAGLWAQKKTVSIKFTFYQPYCGGARPTREMQAEAEKPKPYAKNTIIIISAAGKVDSAKTNGGGVLKLKLKPGQYKLFEAWRYYKLTPGRDAKDNYDAECLDREWQLETFVVDVSGKSAKATETHQITNNCGWNRPCLKDGNRQVPE